MLRISEALSTLEPIAWFLSTAPIFIYTLKQNPKSRWWLLPLNVLPSIQSYRTVNQVATRLPGLDWLLAFTNLIFIIHATSALYIEGLVVPTPPKGAPQRWNTIISFKAWMNPRRIPLRSTYDSNRKPVTTTQRLVFVAKRVITLAILAALYLGIELGILFYLKPGPRDFGASHQKYIHLEWDRAGLFRMVFAFHWAWLTYLILTAANSVLAVVFVGLLQIDDPEEWSVLYGNPFEAYSIQRFWGSFWHHIGTPSQLCYGRLITRRVLRVEPGSTVEKVFLALWVFTVSGVVHGLVTWKTDPEADPLSDFWFLMLNFLAGLVEMSIRHVSLFGGKRKSPTVLSRLMGYLFILAFFYCIVPPYQFPILYKAAVSRMPFKVNMKMNQRS